MAADERDVHVGQNLTKHRGIRSQKALADWMRMRGWKWSQATVWSIEKGERPLKFVEAVDLAEALDIRIEDLLQEPELATATRDVSARTRQTLALAEHATEALIEFERERRNLDDAIDTGVRLPGWDRMADHNQISSALTYTTEVIADMARSQVERERDPLLARKSDPERVKQIILEREQVWFIPDQWRAKRGLPLREDPQEPPDTPQEGTTDGVHQEETER
ncbi:helix-turn-helix transcriptional regulator [Promicromonospora sp. NPDC050249]|uniref:helix-turn-helix transcriptional regulator n=1 Tax=Promicromonospora sp. NPDC050249 TaxID=3154743 RepID=UPI0033DFEF05